MVVLAGTVAADSVEPRMPSGDEVTDPPGQEVYPLHDGVGHGGGGEHMGVVFTPPNDDSDRPQQHPLSSGRPYGQGGAGG